MVKIESLRKYELIVIVDAHLTHEQKEVIFKEVVETVKKSGGKIINSQVWFEKQRMTFDIKKRKEGTYYLINFESDRTAVESMKVVMRLNEKILRYLFSIVEAYVAPEVHTAHTGHVGHSGHSSYSGR